MPASHSESSATNESSVSMQPFVLFLIAVVAGLLIVIPLLPGWIPNVVYSFSGTAPKVYWYLSRAAGFVALTILWVAMALGLGITNKMARLWPGAPAAFAIHEYVSLLGLAFALYHALVLMGDHFVDFSLPRLLAPFSIAYETFWVGLGQLAFYAWIIVVLSFYVRKSIGPKVWRAIHYVNFATYLMGLSHGVFSGTDSSAVWAGWYYWLSALSLLGLGAYRVYEAKLKGIISAPKPMLKKRVRNFAETVASRHVPTIPALARMAREAVSQPKISAPGAQRSALSEPPTVPALVRQTADAALPEALPVEQEAVDVPVVALVEPVTELSEQTPVSAMQIAEHVPSPVLYPKGSAGPDPMEMETQAAVLASTDQMRAPIYKKKGSDFLHLQIKKLMRSIPSQPHTPSFERKKPDWTV